MVVAAFLGAAAEASVRSLSSLSSSSLSSSSSASSAAFFFFFELAAAAFLLLSSLSFFFFSVETPFLLPSASSSSPPQSSSPGRGFPSLSSPSFRKIYGPQNPSAGLEVLETERINWEYFVAPSPKRNTPTKKRLESWESKMHTGSEKLPSRPKKSGWAMGPCRGAPVSASQVLKIKLFPVMTTPLPTHRDWSGGLNLLVGWSTAALAAKVSSNGAEEELLSMTTLDASFPSLGGFELPPCALPALCFHSETTSGVADTTGMSSGFAP